MLFVRPSLKQTMSQAEPPSQQSPDEEGEGASGQPAAISPSLHLSASSPGEVLARIESLVTDFVCCLASEGKVMPITLMPLPNAPANAVAVEAVSERAVQLRAATT